MHLGHVVVAHLQFLFVLRWLPAAGNTGKAFAAIILGVGVARPSGRAYRHIVVGGEAQQVYHGLGPLFSGRDAIAVAAEIQLTEIGEGRLCL